MSLFFKLVPGSWFLRSESDPRWNSNGQCFCGMFGKPEEVDAALEAKKKELQTEPPEDLEWGYSKH